jgi:hypothetical protein
MDKKTLNDFTHSTTEEDEKEIICGCGKKPQQEDKQIKKYLNRLNKLNKIIIKM